MDKDDNVLAVPGKVEGGFGTEQCRNEAVLRQGEGMGESDACFSIRDRRGAELAANTAKGLMHMNLINLSEFLLHCRGHLPLLSAWHPLL